VCYRSTQVGRLCRHRDVSSAGDGRFSCCLHEAGQCSSLHRRNHLSDREDTRCDLVLLSTSSRQHTRRDWNASAYGHVCGNNRLQAQCPANNQTAAYIPDLETRSNLARKTTRSVCSTHTASEVFRGGVLPYMSSRHPDFPIALSDSAEPSNLSTLVLLLALSEARYLFRGLSFVDYSG